MRRFLRLILTNLVRHRVRSAVGIAGIALGTAAMLTVLSILLGAIAMFERILAHDTQMVVFERNVSDLFFSSVPLAEVDKIQTLEGIAGVHPLLFGIVTTPDHPVVTCFGLQAGDPRLKGARWLAGSPESFGTTPGQVWLGRRAAEFMEAQPGDSVPIGRRSFIVGGILETRNGFEDGGVFLPLNEAQEFFNRAKIASILALELAPGADPKAVKDRIDTCCPTLIALENAEFNRGYSQFRILKATGWAVGVCACLLGGLGVANTLLMSVFTRIREIAVLRVCGFSRTQIAGLIFGEALVLCGLGAILGIGIGLGMLQVFATLPQFHGYIQPLHDLRLYFGVPAVALVTSLAGALYPALHAARIQPAAALRYE